MPSYPAHRTAKSPLSREVGANWHRTRTSWPIAIAAIAKKTMLARMLAQRPYEMFMQDWHEETRKAILRNP